MSIKPNLLEIIVCPECKGTLEYQSKDSLLTCPRCKLAYPIDEHGTPLLITDEALPLPSSQSTKHSR